MLHANSSSSVIISVVLMAIVGIVSIGIFNGTLYSLVMSFSGAIPVSVYIVSR